jgi:hypothetical protein
MSSRITLYCVQKSRGWRFETSLGKNDKKLARPHLDKMGMVAGIPSYEGGITGRIIVQASPRQKDVRLYLKNKAKRAKTGYSGSSL